MLSVAFVEIKMCMGKINYSNREFSVLQCGDGTNQLITWFIIFAAEIPKDKEAVSALAWVSEWKLDVEFFILEIPAVNHNTWVEELFSDTLMRRKFVLVFSGVLAKDCSLTEEQLKFRREFQNCAVPYREILVGRF